MDTNEGVVIASMFDVSGQGAMIASLVNGAVKRAEQIADLTAECESLRALNSRNLDKRDTQVNDMQAAINELRNEVQIQKNSVEWHRRDAERWHDDANVLRQMVDRLQNENATMGAKFSLKHGKYEAAYSMLHWLFMTNFIDELFGTDEHDARYDTAWQYAPLFIVDAIHAVHKDKKIERIKVFRQLIADTVLKQAKDFIEADPQYSE